MFSQSDLSQLTNTDNHTSPYDENENTQQTNTTANTESPVVNHSFDSIKPGFTEGTSSATEGALESTSPYITTDAETTDTPVALVGGSSSADNSVQNAPLAPQLGPQQPNLNDPNTFSEYLSTDLQQYLGAHSEHSHPVMRNTSSSADNITSYQIPTEWTQQQQQHTSQFNIDNSQSVSPIPADTNSSISRQQQQQQQQQQPQNSNNFQRHNNRNYDDDLIKLFVGSLPYSSTEAELKPLFDQFGQVEEFTIQRDRTGKSKGCAWLKFRTKEECDECIRSLHEQYCVGSMTNALQVKYANGEEEKAENKVFVGGLPFAITSEQLTAIFSQYGYLREVHIIRKKDGSPTGSAFVKFESRAAAKSAIANVSEVRLDENHVYNVRISFANKNLGKAYKNKDAENNNQQGGGNNQQRGFGNKNNQQQQGFDTNLFQGFGNAAPQLGQQQQTVTPGSAATAAGLQFALNAGLSPQQFANLQAALIAQTANNGIASNNGLNMDAAASMLLNNNSMQQQQQNGFFQPQQQQGQQFQQGNNNYNTQQPGVDGVKLFVGCIPQSVTKMDLLNLFSKFGSLIDVYVLTDNQNKSKGAAFITYANADSASRAIHALNGYQFPGATRGLNVSMSRKNSR